MVDKLAYLRHREHMTAHDISERTGVPLGTLNKILSGKTKNPALFTLERICKVFNVPMRYLCDDSVPDNCCIAAYAENAGMVMLSQREVEQYEKYRSLSEHEKHAFELLLDHFCSYAPNLLASAPERHMICYEPIAAGQRGIYADAFSFRNIVAPVDGATQSADFAIRVADDSLLPVYPLGTVLAVQSIPVTHDQLGLFVVNREGYIRKYFCKRGVKKLVAINVEMKNLTLHDDDEVQCLGMVKGAIRNLRWL